MSEYWSAPKIDWTPADGITEVDLNRIENNILINHSYGFDVSSNIHTSDTIGAGNVQNNQRIYFTIPDGMKLVLKVARYRLNSAGLKLRVWYDIGAGEVVAWTSLSHEGDEEPDADICSGAVSGYYTIQAYNPTGGGLTVSILDGYCLTFAKDEH